MEYYIKCWRNHNFMVLRGCVDRLDAVFTCDVVNDLRSNARKLVMP